MRPPLCPALLAALLAAAAPPAAVGDKEAFATLERAVKAHGGEAALARAQTCRRGDSGTLFRGGKGLPFTREVVRDLPDRLRARVVLDKAFEVVLVLDGDRGWQRADGPAAASPSARARELREEAYLAWVSTLVPLKKAGFTLTALPEAKVHGEAAAGVKASRKGHADVSLYFLKSTGLLARAGHRVLEAGALVSKEYLFSDYKAFGGAQLPTREVLTEGGTKALEVRVSGYKFLSKAEAGKFDRP
jgi:hypothetical protein